MRTSSLAPLFGLRYESTLREIACQLPKKFHQGLRWLLCLHLGVEPAEIIECVKECPSESELDEKLAGLFPKDLKVYAWNRKVVQMGMSDMALDKLEEIKADLGAGQRQDLRSFADELILTRASSSDPPFGQTL